MARLIVEEGGKRRAFRVGDGVLTIGTGQEAKLKVSSTDVAEIHAELSISGGQAVLRTRPGVVPPEIEGTAIEDEAPLVLGAHASIGSVRIWLEDEASPPGSGAAGGAVAAEAGKRAVGNAAQDHAIRRQRAMAEAKRRGDRSVVQRTKPRVQRGLPGYVIALLVVGGAAAVALLVFKIFMSEASKGVAPVQATIAAVERHIEEGSWDLARQKLESISREQTDAERKKIAELFATLDERASQAELDRHNMIGTSYKDAKLAKYEKLYLQGSPEKPKVRVFLMRCKYFRERWPNHPEMDWVDRQERRFRGYVSLGDPPTYEDIEWEVKSLVKTSPRDYKQAFLVIDAFLESAAGGERESALALREEQVAERAEYHLDRMQQARYEYDRDDVAKAVTWLVYSITMIGDEEMEDEAASYLVQIPEVELHLKGWKSAKPDAYAVLVKNSIVREFAREKDIL